MPFGTSDPPSPPRSLKGPEVENIFLELCERKEMAFLVVPALSGLAFDTKFLERVVGARNGLLLRATMNHAMAQSILQHRDVRLRFPWALGFHAAACRALDYRAEEKRHTLLVSLPSEIVPDDRRQAFRLDRVGPSLGAVSTQDLRQLVRVAVEQVSTGGIGLFVLEPIRGEAFGPGCTLHLDITLDKGPRIERAARVIHAAGQVLGLSFEPPLGEDTRKALEAWMAPRIEEERRRWEDRAALRAQAELAARPKAPPSGVLLITRDTDLARVVAKALGGLQELRAAAPVVAEVQKQMDPQPLLILLHVPTVTIEERFRLRSLARALPRRVPLVLLATGEGDQSQALARELKAGAHLHWKTGTGNVLFQSLVQGIIRQAPTS